VPLITYYTDLERSQRQAADNFTPSRNRHDALYDDDDDRRSPSVMAILSGSSSLNAPPS
jgi:hypothetical protein